MNFTKSFQDWCSEHSAEELLRYYEAGANLLPANQVGFSSRCTATFLCSECGYQWNRCLNEVTRKGAKLDCPACHDRIPWKDNIWTKRYPELLLQWDFQANIVEPEQCKNRKSKFYWYCQRCRNRWAASLGCRIRSAELVRSKGGELCPFCSKQKISPQYNLADRYPELSRQFDNLLNEGLQAQECFPASHQKVWWRCDFDPSHVWQDRISNRTLLRRGCPHCARLFKITYTSRALFYYLRKIFPDCICEYPEGRYHIDICLPSCRIAIEHHGYTHWREEAHKRDVRRRDELLQKGYRHVLWLAESPEPISGFILDGDVLTYYDPAPYKKLDQLICYVLHWLEALTGEVIYFNTPDFIQDHQKIENTYYHERRQRSLAVCFPELGREWSKKNGSPPEAVLAGSSRNGIWECGTCKREFTAIVANRTKQHSGCPYCAGKLPTDTNNAAVRFPHLLLEWDAELNDKTLYELLPNTKYLAAWVCSTCGHRWKTMLYNRANPSGSRCPVCTRSIPTDENNLAAKRPDLAALWHPMRNGRITPSQVMPQSNKRWWWICEKGHEWQGAPNSMSKTPVAHLCPYCRNDKACDDNCLSTIDAELAAQWHPTKNGNLTPHDITATSPRRVWWLCAQGHTFRASVYSRHINHTGCPYCINLKVSADNCLAAVFPLLAQEWHPVNNGGLTPQDVTANSTKTVWWMCRKQHEWQAQVMKRSKRGQGCPYCSGRRVSPEHCLAAVQPELITQWHPVKNGTLTPWDVAPCSGKKVWWVCESGHEWQSSVSNRRKGRGCPYCAKRLQKGITLDIASPELCAQWHPTYNSLPPSAYMAHSNKKVWWRCERGHEWQATPDSRMDGSGCPYCNGRLASKENCLATLNPVLAAEWDYDVNDNLTPEQVLPRSMRMVGWICQSCGCRWNAPIAYRTEGSGCPVCRKKKKS